MRVEPSQNLFAAYCGLVAAGYDMVDESDIKLAEIINSIKRLVLSVEIIKHFSLAKTNEVSVNPYFPRANAITALCFFLDDTFESYIEFLESTGTIICDQEFQAWASKLPEMISIIKNNPDFSCIWDKYNKVISERIKNCRNILNKVEHVIRDYGYHIEDIELVYSLNLLQSPYIADYVLRENKLYVISVECTTVSLLHEYLHIAVSKLQPQLIDIVRRIGIHELVDEVKMKDMGYILNDSLEGQCHALEDCIVRGLSGIMSEFTDMKSYCAANEQSGFKFTSKFIEYAKHEKPTKDRLISFIHNIIEDKSPLLLDI